MHYKIVCTLSLLLARLALSTNPSSAGVMGTSNHIQVDSSGKSKLIRRSDSSHPEHAHLPVVGAQSMTQAKTTAELQTKSGKWNFVESTLQKPATSYKYLCLMTGFGYSSDMLGNTQSTWKNSFSYFFAKRSECDTFCLGNSKCWGYITETPADGALPFCTFVAAKAFSQALVPASTEADKDNRITTYKIEITMDKFEGQDIMLNDVVARNYNASNLCYFPDQVPCDNQWGLGGHRFYYVNREQCTKICRETENCAGYVDAWNYPVKFCQFKSCNCNTLTKQDGISFYALPRPDVVVETAAKEGVKTELKKESSEIKGDNSTTQ